MRLFMLIFSAFALCLILGSVSAQAKEAVMKPFPADQIEKGLFPNTKSGCRNKYQFYTVALIQYRKGVAVSDFVEMKLMEPMVQKVYDQIRSEGASKTTLGAMKEYQSCSESAEPESSAEYEAKEVEFFSSCGGVNAVALAAIEGLEKKKEQKYVEDQVKGIKINTAGTRLEQIENPELYIVSHVYAAGKESYDKAVEYGAGLLTTCFVSKR